MGSYLVKTGADAYVGSMPGSGFRVTNDCPRQFAYAFSSEEAHALAERVAESTGQRVEVVPC